jgi:hypothetical protein
MLRRDQQYKGAGPLKKQCQGREGRGEGEGGGEGGGLFRPTRPIGR